MNNLFELHGESFDFFKEFGVKLIYKNSNSFTGGKKYIFIKNEGNNNNNEKYQLHIDESIGEIELAEILFSLEKELEFDKYDLLEDLISKIKIKIEILTRNNQLNNNNFNGISKHTQNKIKNYNIDNIFRYRKYIKNIKNDTNKNIEDTDEILNELYKSFYNLIFHIGIDYQRNFSKTFTKQDLKKLLENYNITDINKKNKKVLLTQNNIHYFDENEEYLKDKLKLDLFKKKIIEKIENKTLTKDMLYDYIRYIYLHVYEYPSIYQDFDGFKGKKIEDLNFIDITENKQLMCASKNSLLYSFFAGIENINFSTNLEPHHITSNISFKTLNGEYFNYYLEPTLFLDLSKEKDMNDKLGEFNIKLILDENDKYLKESNIINGKSKNILFSAYLANYMYSIVSKNNINKQELNILESIYKYSIMSEPNNYISYRGLGIGYIKYGKKLKKEGNTEGINNYEKKGIKYLKKSLSIYPLDYFSWKEISLKQKKYDITRLITSLIYNTNKGKMDFILDKYHSTKIYEKYNLNKNDFLEIKEIFKNREFNNLLHYLPKN